MAVSLQLQCWLRYDNGSREMGCAGSGGGALPQNLRVRAEELRFRTNKLINDRNNALDKLRRSVVGLQIFGETID